MPELEDEIEAGAVADGGKFEVHRLYAPKAPTYSNFYMTSGQGAINIEQYGDTHAGEPGRDDYVLEVEASFVGYGNERWPVRYDDLDAGEKRDEWHAKYGERVEQGLLERIKRDRAFLRARRGAVAKLASMLPMLKDVSIEEQLYEKSMMAIGFDAVGSKQGSPATVAERRKRSFKLWSTQRAKEAKASEKKKRKLMRQIEVAKSATTQVGTAGKHVATVMAPPRDMKMPMSLKQAFNDPAFGTQWREAAAVELAGLQAKNAYVAVKLPPGKKPLSMKPIFKIKFNADGTLDKFKIRLVVGGHKAVKEEHYNETFSPVLSITVLRLILAIFAAYPHVVTTVVDVEQAYLWSHIEEEVYVRAPEGVAVPSGWVLKLLKAIYGMPQAGREFWKLLRGIILSLGFRQSEHAHCFFWKREARGFIILMTYVDDITITTDCPAMRAEVFDAIAAQVTLEDRGVIGSFLGMQFKYNAEERYWSITQEVFTLDLCASMGLTPGESKAAYTPEIKQPWSKEMATAKSDEERTRVAKFNPRSKLGSCMWALACCRPDIMHSLKNPAQYVTDPGDAVVAALTRVGRYLLGTADEGLRLYGSTGAVKMRVASDADDSGGVDRRSMLCHMSWIGCPLTDTTGSARRAFFHWTSAWSIAVPCGSMESEIYAIHAAMKGTAATRALIGEIGLHDGEATELSVDSSSAKTVLQGEHSEKISTGVKHIDRRVLGVRQQIAAHVNGLASGPRSWATCSRAAKVSTCATSRSRLTGPRPKPRPLPRPPTRRARLSNFHVGVVAKPREVAHSTLPRTHLRPPGTRLFFSSLSSRSVAHQRCAASRGGVS
jgi:hypothetical protein